MLLFKAYKKTNKNIFYNFFPITKNDTWILSKTQRKTPKRGTWKISKSFWRRKREKATKGSRKISKSYWRRKQKRWNKNLSEEEKQELVEYRRNYYFHIKNKHLVTRSLDQILLIFMQLKKKIHRIFFRFFGNYFLVLLNKIFWIFYFIDYSLKYKKILKCRKFLWEWKIFSCFF